jgi:uncharacterized protein (TIGR00290 family)
MPHPLIVSWSGGKDSTLALAALRASAAWEPIILLTSVTAGYDRVAIHGVRRDLLREQAAALGLELREFTLEPGCSNDEYDAAHAAALRDAAAESGARQVAFGDLFLEDVRRYREERVSALGLEPLFPLWGEDTALLARRFVAEGYRAHLVCVDTTQLAADFAGRSFDAALLRDLPEGVDPCGERGEFHTFVGDGPGFTRAVRCAPGEVVLRDARFAYCELVPEGHSSGGGAAPSRASAPVA